MTSRTAEGYTLTPGLGLCANPTTNAAELNKLKVRAWISTGMELNCTPIEVRLVDDKTIAIILRFLIIEKLSQGNN